MKTEQRTIQIPAYRTDDGKPICGGCKLQAPNGLCQYSKAEAGYYPSSSCPVWHGERKPALVIELLEKISRVAHGEDQVGDNDEGDAMRYRVINKEFLNIFTDVESWIPLSAEVFTRPDSKPEYKWQSVADWVKSLGRTDASYVFIDAGTASEAGFSAARETK